VAQRQVNEWMRLNVASVPASSDRERLRHASDLPGKEEPTVVHGSHRPFREGDVVLTTTDDRWWRNFQPDAPVTLLMSGRKWTGTARAVTEAEANIEGMRSLIKGLPKYGKWIDVRLDGAGEPPRADLDREVENGRVLIRIPDVTEALK
jgi:hypothetical protein